MKILLTTSIFPPEIAEPAQYVKKLANELTKEHQITIITYANAVEEIVGANIITINKNQSLIGRFFDYYLKISKLINNYNLIIAQNSIASALPLAIASRIKNVKFVLRYQEDEIWERLHAANLADKPLHQLSKLPLKYKIYYLLQIIILAQADKIFTTSEYLKKALIDVYTIKDKKISVINHPLHDLDKIGLEIVKKEKQIFIYADEKEKAHFQNFFDKLGGLKQQLPDYDFVINNHYSKPEIEYYLKTSGTVIFLNKLNYKPDMIAAALSLSEKVLLNKNSILKEFVDNEQLINLENLDELVKLIKKNNLFFNKPDFDGWSKHCDNIIKLRNAAF